MPDWLIWTLGIIGGCGALAGIYRSISHFQLKSRDKHKMQFVTVRNYIKNNRQELLDKIIKKHMQNKSKVISLHKNIPLLVGENWVPKKPIDLNQLKIDMIDEINPNLVKKEPRIYNYDTYTSAIISLDKPLNLRNNRQYRLLKVNSNSLTFSNKAATYYDKINYGSSLAFVLADSVINHRKMRIYPKLMKKLKVPAQYIILTGVNTLTLLRTKDKLRLIMHQRGKSETATAMGTYHVIPAGEFQPSSIAPKSFKEDFDIWKNIMRESAEELANMDEYDGNNGILFDYNQEPFISLESERDSGNIKPFYLGIGLDPITYQGEILTCVVYKEETFHKIFPKIILKNNEGIIITEKKRWGCDLTNNEINSYLESNTLPACKSILQLVNEYRIFFQNCIEN